MVCFNRFYLLILLGILAPLAACVPMDQPNGSISSGIMGERRSPDDAIEDNVLAIKLRSYYMRSDKVSAANINVSVYEGMVLLTGTASSQQEIDSAVDIAKATRGVKKVHSELKVQHATFMELTKDVWYTNQVKIRILADEQVRGLDIHVETTKGVVYLTGTAQSLAERDRAIEIARQVKGVAEVVSYIKINVNAQPLTPGLAEPNQPATTTIRSTETLPAAIEPAQRNRPVATTPVNPYSAPIKPGTPIDRPF